jgi:hypothetical protein
MCCCLRGYPARKFVPVIMITARAEPGLDDCSGIVGIHTYRLEDQSEKSTQR